MKKGVLGILLLIGIFLYFNSHKKAEPEEQDSSQTVTEAQKEAKVNAPSPPPAIEPTAPTTVAPPSQPVAQPLPKSETRPSGKSKNVLPYVMEDGVVVVQGDWVAGIPAKENADANGWVEVPTLRLWDSSVIPVHIDSSVKNPDRVKQALEMFEGTAVQFVPFNNQKDAIVFVDGTGTCKSYVGKVGGHQPLWIPEGCGAREIAHELMHALGFVHEQNRSDRDQFIQVQFENVDETFKDNFEKLPTDFMKASGQGSFDFDSLMIYPVWMFAKNGKATMVSRSGQQINPSQTLSPNDIDRINRVYQKGTR